MTDTLIGLIDQLEIINYELGYYDKQSSTVPFIYDANAITPRLNERERLRNSIEKAMRPSEISGKVFMCPLCGLPCKDLGNNQYLCPSACDATIYLRGGSTVGAQPEKATSPVSTTAPEATTSTKREIGESITAQQAVDAIQAHADHLDEAVQMLPDYREAFNSGITEMLCMLHNRYKLTSKRAAKWLGLDNHIEGGASK